MMWIWIPTNGGEITLQLHVVSKISSFVVYLTTESPGALAADLLSQTKDVSSLNSSQVNNLVNQLENLLSAPNISLDVGRAMLSVINNLLNCSTDTLASSSNR